MRLKSTSLILFLLLVISQKSYSQASIYTPYTFTTAASGGAIPPGTAIAALAAQDDNQTVLTPGAGFSFPFAGVNYTNFLISSNGWIAPIPSLAVPGYFPATGTPINNLTAYAGPVPIIAPIWDDVLTGTCGYTVSATNLIIRWNLRVPKNSAANGYFVGVDLASNGTITFLYPAVTTYKPDGLNLQSASIGFADGCGEFYSVNVLSSNTQSVSDLTETATNYSQVQTTISQAATGNTVNVGSTAGITVGMFVGGTNIPGGATVTAVGATSVTISAPTTILATGTGNFFIHPNGHKLYLHSCPTC